MVVSCLANMVEIKGPCRAATQRGGSVSCDSRARRFALYAVPHGLVGLLYVVVLFVFGCFLALSWHVPGFWWLSCARSWFGSARGLPELKLVLSCYLHIVCIRVFGYSWCRDGCSHYCCLSHALAICFTAASCFNFIHQSSFDGYNWRDECAYFRNSLRNGSAGYGTQRQIDSAKRRTCERFGFGGDDRVECEDRDFSAMTATPHQLVEAGFKGGSVGKLSRRSFAADYTAMTLRHNSALIASRASYFPNSSTMVVSCLANNRVT